MDLKQCIQNERSGFQIAQKQELFNNGFIVFLSLAP